MQSQDVSLLDRGKFAIDGVMNAPMTQANIQRIEDAARLLKIDTGRYTLREFEKLRAEMYNRAGELLPDLTSKAVTGADINALREALEVVEGLEASNVHHGMAPTPPSTDSPQSLSVTPDQPRQNVAPSRNLSTDNSHVIDIQDRHGIELLSDGAALGTWELLRRFDKPISAGKIAWALGVDLKKIEAALERLIENDIVGCNPIRGSRRAPTYFCRKSSMAVEYRPNDPNDKKVYLAALPRIGVGDQAVAPRFQAITGEAISRHVRLSTHLTPKDAEELQKRVDDLRAFVALLDSRYVKEAALNGVECNYTLDIALQPNSIPKPPSPIVVFRPIGTSESSGPDITTAATILSDREQQVAVGLIGNQTFVEIAKSLGITSNTVAQFTRRIYRKLGINSRRALRDRLLNPRGSE